MDLQKTLTTTCIVRGRVPPKFDRGLLAPRAHSAVRLQEICVKTVASKPPQAL